MGASSKSSGGEASDYDSDGELSRAHADDNQTSHSHDPCLFQNVEASDSDSDGEEDWAALRAKIKKDTKANNHNNLLFRPCDPCIFQSMDDKACFAKRLEGHGLHPPTVSGRDCSTWEEALDVAERSFPESKLWFVKHCRRGGGKWVTCVDGRAQAASLVKDSGWDVQDYIVQANVDPKLVRGWKSTIRCYGVFFKGRAYYSPDHSLVKKHGQYYDDNSTDPAIHVLCSASDPGVTCKSGSDFFSDLAQTDDAPAEQMLHDAARRVLGLFAGEALLVPPGEHCLVGLDFLLAHDGRTVCIEANIPCSTCDLVGSKSEEIKLQMRRSLKLLLKGSSDSSFQPV